MNVPRPSLSPFAVGEYAHATPPTPAARELTPIHTLWIGEALGPCETLCLHSWLRLGHRVVLHGYSRLDAPEGVEFFDARELCPPDDVERFRAARRLPVFADYYRALILRRFDAIWLDTDICLLRPLDFRARNVLTREGSDEPGAINNSLLRLNPEHPILDRIVERYRRPWTALPWSNLRKTAPILNRAIRTCGLRPWHLQWGALGALAIEAHIDRHGFEGEILNPRQSLTAARVPLFRAIETPEAWLESPVLYAHFYRSNFQEGPQLPEPGSIYGELWARVCG